jgi:hypothetical protein
MLYDISVGLACQPTHTHKKINEYQNFYVHSARAHQNLKRKVEKKRIRFAYKPCMKFEFPVRLEKKN